MASSDAIASPEDTEFAGVLRRAADFLEGRLEQLSGSVSERCFAELESYRREQMPRSESEGTVGRLLTQIVCQLRKASEGTAAEDARALHDELVTLEQGIAARRVRMAIGFDDLLAGIQITREEVWTALAKELSSVTAEEVFTLEKRINAVFDEFLMGLASAYLKSQAELLAAHESALAKWEEVVRSASEIRLKVPCREEFAAIVRLQAEAIARRVQFSSEEIYDIITAVGEVCDNAIEHGTSELGIEVQYLMTPTEFQVEVKDYGEGFDPAGRGDEPPDLFSERGRGIFLMKNLMDRVEIDSHHGRGTRVVIGKKRRPLGP